MPFRFRLRVRMATPIDKTVQSLNWSNFHPIEVSSRADALPPRTWVTFEGSKFASDAEARNAGDSFRDALSIVGVLNRLGVDVGFDRTGLTFSKELQEANKKVTGRELSGDT